MEAQRRISFLIAEKSMHIKFIGATARAAGAIPVARALDMTKPGTGKIYLPNPDYDLSLIRGVGTLFEKETQIGGLLVLPSIDGTAASAEILEIHNDEEVRLKKEFKGDAPLKQLTGREPSGNHQIDIEKVNGPTGVSEGFSGTSFKTAPKIDQTMVYDAVFERLESGGCVGIFPEGGSHDRTELLPLKGTCAWFLRNEVLANLFSGRCYNGSWIIGR